MMPLTVTKATRNGSFESSNQALAKADVVVELQRDGTVLMVKCRPSIDVLVIMQKP